MQVILGSRLARRRRRRFVLTAAIAGLLFAGAGSPGAAQAAPLISGTAGSGANAYFLAVDFNDFAAPQSYAFEYFSDATSLSFADVLQGLTAVPTFSIDTPVFPGFGLTLNGIAYDGKSKDTAAFPTGFWSQWHSADGAAWDFNDFGISDQPVAAGQWVGASWDADFNVAATAPRVPQIAAAAAPEPGALALALTGAATAAGAGLVRRRRPRGAGAPV